MGQWPDRLGSFTAQIGLADIYSLNMVTMLGPTHASNGEECLSSLHVFGADFDPFVTLV